MSKKVSKVTVPNDPAYVKGIVSYCSELCAGIGFTPRDIDEISRALGVKRTHTGPFDHKAGGLPEESVLELSIKPFHKTAVIYVKGYGRDLVKRVNAKLIELTNRGFNAVYLDLKLRDPHTPDATGRLEGLGCFFSGLLPDYADGDILRLQYYNTRVEYDELLTESPFAEDLLEYVKGLDTKWSALHSG